MEETKTYEIACKVLPCAMKAIKDNGGSMRLKELVEHIEQTAELSEYELAKTKSGSVRWRSVLQYYSIDAVKAGLLLKKQGNWIITAEGEKALAKGGRAFVDAANDGYDEWKLHSVVSPDTVIEDSHPDTIGLDDIQSRADEGIRDYIRAKNPYEFQDLVAALLRAMGYYTPFIAPKGKDGGIDIIAYQDPLGTMQPTLKVQVKHYPTTPISVDVVRSLIGTLTKDGEVGLLVTSGTFTSEAVREARHSHQRLRLINIDELITLWIEYYDKISENDKALLPILPVYFVKPQTDE